MPCFLFATLAYDTLIVGGVAGQELYALVLRGKG